MGLWGRYRHGNTGKGRFATIPFLFYNKFPSIKKYNNKNKNFNN